MCFGRDEEEQVLPERQVSNMTRNTGWYTRADVISLLQVISILSDRIACRMRMTEAPAQKGGNHVKDERLISNVG